MEISAGYLEKFNRPRVSQPRTEREEMYDKFLERLNPPRVEAGLKPLTEARLATTFKGIPTADLYGFYKSCERANSFTRLFWYLLKPKT